MKNVKEFLDCLKDTGTRVLNYENFLSELSNTQELSTKGPLKTNMLTPKEGLISIDTFLDNLFTYKNQGHFLSDKEIKELGNDNTNYIFTNELYTGNLEGNYLAHDVSIDMFINDNGNYLVFLQVHGADMRWGFSSYVAIKFNTKNDYKNAFYDGIEYDLGSCSIETEDGTTATIKVTSSPFDYPANMYAIDDDTFEEIFITEVGCADFGNIKDEVTNYISNDKKLSKKFHVIEFDGYDGNVYIAN